MKAAALTSEDGAFSIVPAMAVELAYMLSNAEHALHRGMDRMEVLELIGDYLDGSSSPAEIMAELASEAEDS